MVSSQPHSSPGDPNGRRIAARKATLLSEAARVAQALERLLERAGSETDDIHALAKRITIEEQTQLLKAHGRIESRGRFKFKSSHPLLAGREPNLLFLDESGKPGPGREPVFSLGAVAMTESASAQYQREADELKLAFFGPAKSITFHEPHMRRHETVFRFEDDVGRQREFCEAVDSLVERTAFVAFGVAIRKTELEELRSAGTEVHLPWDVYGIAIHLLMERYVDYLAKTRPQSLGRATFESQGPREDAEHHIEYTQLLLAGTQCVSDSNFRNWLETSAHFAPKSGSHGTELADMLSRDLYEWTRDGCTGKPRRWPTFTQKAYRRGDMRMGKFGFKVFPDSDIRDRIEEHRDESARSN